MNKLKLLIVEGNTKEENVNFVNAGCVPQSQNFKQHINKLKPNCEIDIVEPGSNESVSKILSSLKKYDGVVLTGSTLRIEEKSNEVKKHIEFAKKLFDYEMSSNIGNWQWVAGCGVDAAPYFRIFNPTEQIKKFDSEFKYIKTWVPNFQEIDYPKPIVDHKEARERCLLTYKTALNRI